jgi:hypothetical protein
MTLRNQIIRVRRRWGYSISGLRGEAVGLLAEFPCYTEKSELLFRKHLFNPKGECRRCAIRNGRTQ